MKTKYWRYLIGGIVAVLLLVMVYASLSQPGVQDLKGDYRELARYRNENNTGPVIRIFAVATDGKQWEEMRAYGDFMPHTKYGNTRVFFFDRDLGEIELSPEPPYFDAKWERYCIATYEKTAMGQVRWQQVD
ncbi:hypothetical protein SAMN05192553_104295 [Cyclobacterium xiamenense]|uniref:Uncharacterized protein n=1 Tax=Cyclobacterium xiamenense TaxID=1297121 RepID=A0A1H6ZC57_9BACT|nr:hypothetical protein [Cyclobacterium xiamenense]SEJ49654.1 hypothetical protein SAMN05192553_104295 [Cyclobacterium xiamenense]